MEVTNVWQSEDDHGINATLFILVKFEANLPL